ncbi:MAG: hypothetical protein SFV51_02370 [Bryobacteraceae bacterium]|nr:hypothetical protein [Bryobacteraceae bacterium]
MRRNIAGAGSGKPRDQAFRRASRFTCGAPCPLAFGDHLPQLLEHFIAVEQFVAIGLIHTPAQLALPDRTRL